MTWIKTETPGPNTPELTRALTEARTSCPPEYGIPGRNVPPLVLRDSIVLAHSLVPSAMRHLFAAYGAMMDPALPLTRRQHEMIAATVSSLNRCFY